MKISKLSRLIVYVVCSVIYIITSIVLFLMQRGDGDMVSYVFSSTMIIVGLVMLSAGIYELVKYLKTKK
jgi:K+ transporter